MAGTHHFEPYHRVEPAPVQPPPVSTTGVVGWIRENLFPNWWNAILTLVSVWLIYVVVSEVIEFAFVKAVWTGDNREDCLAENAGHEVGACWAYVRAKFGQFIYGFYPIGQRWRVDLTFLLGALLIVPLAIPGVPWKRENALLLFVAYPVVAFFLLSGGIFGLPVVESYLWGGLLLTLVIAITGIVASLPLGILLALGRRSKMPVIRLLSVIFIEFWRGVPLITVLFMSSVMLPLFLPEGTTLDKVVRPLIGVALFASAYMAEVIRGGLQAIPRGQYEGAQALGLSYWQTMGLIILPQALKLVIPGIVNTFIGLFKDTTLVSIIGLADLLGIVQTSFADAEWSTPTTAWTAYLFTAMVYWLFCFSMSRYSIFMEHRLHTGHRR